MTSARTQLGPWPGRLALAAALAALPLFIFGGAVTTLEAGLAVDGWLVAEGHLLPLFPVEKWLRDPQTFVEHTHRMFGMLVGLCALAALGASLRARAGRAMAALALLAVMGQGTIGGLRVLEQSAELAFLHGVLGQGVFALLFATALMLSPRWRSARAGSAGATPARLAWLTALAVFAQIGIGAWYRHGLRPLTAGVEGRLQLHILGALFVTGLVLALAARLSRAPAGPLTVHAVRLRIFLGLQLCLGLGSLAALQLGGAAELAFSILHVLVGALLLSQTVGAALWCGRLGAPARPVALDQGAARAGGLA